MSSFQWKNPTGPNTPEFAFPALSEVNDENSDQVPKRFEEYFRPKMTARQNIFEC